MIILITGASHTGKTALAQKHIKNIKYPLFIHRAFKNGALFAVGNTTLTYTC